MNKKQQRVYVREDSNKRVRKEREHRRVSKREVYGRKRENSRYKKKNTRMWTLNRSPHGNKTAREQFGRDHWQRERVRSCKKTNVDQSDCSARQRFKDRVYKKGIIVSIKEKISMIHM